MSPTAPSYRARRGVVIAVGVGGGPLVDCEVDVDGLRVPAIAYRGLVGDLGIGDHVLLNTTARHLGLGTGGVDLVVAVEGRTPPDPPSEARGMKARYLPQQVSVALVEETHAAVLATTTDLAGLPVVAAPLHSLVAPIAAGARAAGARRIAHVMTDGAALPLAFSRLVPTLRDAGFLDATVTVGQAFGGDLEAVTLWSGLLACAAVLEADVVVVADGPGNLGTETTWGVSALASGLALNAASLLGGRPVAALRVSFADARARHRGLSHHTRTILGRVCAVETDVAVPTLPEDQRTVVWDALRADRLEERHRLVEVDGRAGLAVLAEAGIAVTSMGRSPEEDPAFFLAGAAAGVLAGRMAVARSRWRR